MPRLCAPIYCEIISDMTNSQHNFARQSAPLQAGWYCVRCGYFVVGKLTETEKARDCRNSKPFSWGDVFNRHLAKGEDHASAAYAADEAEKRAKRTAK